MKAFEIQLKQELGVGGKMLPKGTVIIRGQVAIEGADMRKVAAWINTGFAEVIYQKQADQRGVEAHGKK